MARILVFVFLAFLVWLAVRLLRSRGARGTDAGEASAVPQQKAPEAIEQCAWCGVHAPAGAAVSLPDGRVYCSDAHRDQARLAAAPSGSDP